MQNSELGTIIKISGPVLDVQFRGKNPAVHNLLKAEDGVHMEVAAHIGQGLVRAIALEATDGLCCGTKVQDTGSSIKVPVGKEVLGRVVNVLGAPIDDKGPVPRAAEWEIHRDPPAFSDIKPVTEVLRRG